ncbi:MAG: hypothetical protein ABJG47_13860 [Ekhidna sp.]
MKEFERIESLLKTKAYEELTASERILVDQELTQEIYEELRVSITLLKGERLQTGKDVKHSLMAEFKAKEAKSTFAFFRYKLPAYTHLVPLSLIVYLIFFLPSEERVVTQDRIVEVMVRDTVTVTQVDTLWVEKVLRVSVPVYVTQASQAEKTEEIQPVTNRSLSEQKEVMDLVIRGK